MANGWESDHHAGGRMTAAPGGCKLYTAAERVGQRSTRPRRGAPNETL